MNIVITGSLGHISKPLTQELLQKGHHVTVISSKEDRKQEIEALGAKAAIGSVKDTSFLANTFKGADVVYCMHPPVNFFDKTVDLMADAKEVAVSYKNAILASGVKRLVHLSSIGAHTDKGVGMLKFHYYIEQILHELPADVAIMHMRPVGFYYNLFANIPAIKSQGVIAANYGGDDVEPLVSPIDIAAATAEEIVKPFTGRNVRYVASEEISCSKVASILGAAIGKPDLQWIIIPADQLLNGMLAVGVNQEIAKGYVEMNEARHSGILFEDYNKHKPQLGKVKVSDFAKEFAAVYNQ